MLKNTLIYLFANTAFLLCAAFSGTLMASEINECHNLSNNSERLSCYDELSGFESSEPIAHGTERKGSQWYEDSETSALDQRTDIWLSVKSNSTQPNQIGEPEKGALFLRCIQNKTDVLILFNDYTTDRQSVKYKLDEDPVSRVSMFPLRGGEGLGLKSGGDSIMFIRKLFNHETLILSYASYSDQALEFTFDISGLEERVSRLANSCNWSP